MYFLRASIWEREEDAKRGGKGARSFFGSSALLEFDCGPTDVAECPLGPGHGPLADGK